MICYRFGIKIEYNITDKTYNQRNIMNLYGIKSCPSCKKAFAFFKQHGIEYTFVDLNKEPVNEAKIRYWLQFVDGKVLFNTRSKGYRDMGLKNENLSLVKNLKHLWEDNSFIKRPVIEHGLNGEEKLYVGFDEKEYQATFLG